MSNHESRIGYVSLGSNMGDTRANLTRAVAALDALTGVAVEAVSDIFHTEPQGRRDQDWFANMVARIAVSQERGPEDLLDRLLDIETRLGRIRTEVWGPRVIDLDLLLLGDQEFHSARLTLPHPRMRERAFVLVPLRQLAPDLAIHGLRAEDWLSRLNYTLNDHQIWQA